MIKGIPFFTLVFYTLLVAAGNRNENSSIGATLVPLAWRRVEQGLPMPGVIFVPQEYPQRRALDLLVALVEVSTEADFADRVTYLTNFEGMVAR